MKQRVFFTGATGGMGFASLKEMLKDSDKQDIVILARDSEKNRNILKPYTETPGLEIVWGDLNNYEAVLEYCSDRDSARAMKNLCAFLHDGSLEESFWGHIYNIGG
ncbi:MAG: hypothetical protein EGR45_09370, partial [Ruminococcaceae bacterium]|nr:hypothetical protein [Oscillospiraceae bacterium]